MAAGLIEICLKGDSFIKVEISSLSHETRVKLEQKPIDYKCIFFCLGKILCLIQPHKSFQVFRNKK